MRGRPSRDDAERLKEELVDRMTPRGHRLRRGRRFANLFGGATGVLRRRRDSANLVGVGFGAKETGGAFTGALAVRVYVTRRFRLAELSSGCRIPREIAGVPTDVIVIGRVRHHARPVAYGAAISHEDGLRGSLGCVVTVQGADGAFVLSAAHVLAPRANSAPGDSILEPPAGVAGSGPFATLSDFERLQGDNALNEMDAGIARLLRSNDVVRLLPDVGPVGRKPVEPHVEQSVRKVGSSTALTRGIVADVSADIRLRPVGGDPLLFRQVIEVDGEDGPFSAGGDSGSLVVDALARPLGLVFGGQAKRTFVTPMARVLQRFGAHIA